ncbi:MAG: flagellar hook-length control protein FliK [Thermodesulfobacteriota bacterium]
MNTLLSIQNLFPQAGEAVPMVPGSAGQGEPGLFASVMRSKLGDRGENLFGAIPPATAPLPPPGVDLLDEAMAESDGVAELLAQFLAVLQGVARDGDEKGGQWVLPLPAEDHLAKLAQALGMDERQLAALRQLFVDNETAGFPEFFGQLQRHLEEIASVRPLTTLETDLPLVQSLLVQMGFDGEQVARVTAKAVTGDDRLDLEALLGAIEQLTPPPAGLGPADLSDWDAEQLWQMMAAAGGSPSLKEVFVRAVPMPVDLPGQPLPIPESQPFSFGQLTGFLEKGIGDIKASQPQVDLPGFLRELGAILKDAGIAGGGRQEWTPLLQKSMTEMYDQLNTLVDLATVTAEAGDGLFARYVEELPVWMEDLEGDGPVQDQLLKIIDREAPGLMDRLMAADVDGRIEMPAPPPQPPQGSTPPVTGGEGTARPTPHPHQPMHTLVFDQLQQGVMRGLEKGEQHLVLKLYPPELGEVKVDLLLRNDQLSLAFSLDNNRVKEALQAHMQQFQDNLAQRGFTLGQCFVSVGQQQQDEGSRWRQMLASLRDGGKSGGSGPIRAGEEPMYLRNLDAATAGAINLIV